MNELVTQEQRLAISEDAKALIVSGMSENTLGPVKFVADASPLCQSRAS